MKHTICVTRILLKFHQHSNETGLSWLASNFTNEIMVVVSCYNVNIKNFVQRMQYTDKKFLQALKYFRQPLYITYVQYD